MAGYEEMKSEALKRLGKFDLHHDVARYFDDAVDSVDGLYYSERMKLGSNSFGVLYWLSNNPYWEKYVREFERDYDCMVYHITHEYTTFGELLTMLFVSGNEDEWEYDNEALDNPFSDGTRYVDAYVYNITDPLLSEIGLVGIRNAGGGMIRTQ